MQSTTDITDRHGSRQCDGESKYQENIESVFERFEVLAQFFSLNIRVNPRYPWSPAVLIQLRNRSQLLRSQNSRRGSSTRLPGSFATDDVAILRSNNLFVLILFRICALCEICG